MTNEKLSATRNIGVAHINGWGGRGVKRGFGVAGVEEDLNKRLLILFLEKTCSAMA